MDVHSVATAALGAVAAKHVVDAAAAAIQARGEFLVAFSGGTTPAPMLDALVTAELPWEQIHILQVDERVAPDGDPSRNLTLLRDHLLARIRIPRENVHPMPVSLEDLDGALRAYRALLRRVGGDPPVLDLVHLGLGADGHTASLTPEGEAVESEDEMVVLTPEVGGYRRMTLTRPVLDAARRRLWVVAGADKRQAVARLLAGDPAIPAGRIRRADGVLVVDDDADPGPDHHPPGDDAGTTDLTTEDGGPADSSAGESGD